MKMALRRNAKEQLFWGCGNYPYCRVTSRYSAEPPLGPIVTSHTHKRRQEQEAGEKIAAEQAALARPEVGPKALSQRAMPSPSQSANGWIRGSTLQTC